jgi:methylmalonyl-CoA mutase cobalamin-binding domain/chain
MTPQTKGTAVIAAAQNDLHDIGARIVSDILEMEGWKVFFVGANTPNRELMKLIRDVRPDLLGISVVVPIHLLHVEELIRQIRSEATLHDIKIMVGGPAFFLSENLWRQIGADALVMNGTDASQYASEFWQRCK